MRLRLLVIVATAALLLPAGAASASYTFTLSYLDPVYVGTTQLQADLTVSVTSETESLREIHLAPSCAVADQDAVCRMPESGVFEGPDAATGDAGTACADEPFSVSAPDASGVVIVEPAAPLPLTNGQTCSVRVDFDTLKLPAADVMARKAGSQTFVSALAVLASGNKFASRDVTVLPAPVADAPAKRRLSLKAGRKRVKRDRKVTLSGRLAAPTPACTGGQTVILQKQAPTNAEPPASFKPVRSAVTDASGSFSLKVRIKRKSAFKATIDANATCAAAESGQVTVGVKKPGKG